MDRSDRPDTIQVLNLGGTERICSAEQTLVHIQPLLQEAGITRLARLTHLDTLGIPVYTAIRPASKSLSSAQGKGMTDALAMCSAYMEALEYYFAERVPLDGFSAASTLDADQRCFEQLPPGFIQANPNRAIEWTTCFDDYTHKKIQVPRHFLSFDLTEARIENGWFKKSTAGLASGNSREEALVHSLCELIEHHAAHAFRALSFEEKKELLLQEDDLPPLPQALMEQLAPHDIQCLIFQMPNVFHIPSFYCLLINTHPLRSLYQYEGYGCHLNAEVALLRAITEAAQSRLTYIAGSRDDMMPFRYQHTTKILSIEATEKKRRFSDIVSRAGLSVVDQLTALQTALKQQGFTQHLYQEHTPDSYPVSVVHSIIPGLCI